MVKYSKLREITTVFAMKCTLFFFLRSVGVYVKSRRTQHNSCTKNNNSIFVKANSFFYARSSRRCRLCLCTVSLLVAFEFDVFWLSLRPGTAKTKTNKKPFAWMLSFLFVFNWWFCVFQCVLFFFSSNSIDSSFSCFARVCSFFLFCFTNWCFFRRSKQTPNSIGTF